MRERKTCKVCGDAAKSRGLCGAHYEERRRKKAPAKKPKRDESKTAYSRVRVWARKAKRELLLTLEDYQELRREGCRVCRQEITGVGMGVQVSDKKGPINVQNVVPMCGLCRMHKPRADWDLVTHCTRLLRRGWKRTPMAAIAMLRARLDDGTYRCAKCDKNFRKKDTQLDHIEPVIEVDRGFIDLDTFAERLFCSEDNLQVLCKPCHKLKTKAENEMRRFHAKERD